jgi:hypothetical protein
MSTFADKAYRFFTTLELDARLPKGVEVMNPYRDKRVRECFRGFLDAHFNDDRKRVFVFGINPGRFGAGITGIAFTDPVALSKFCGIPNALGDKRESSSRFIYQFIERWGGTKKFYRDFFLTATCPLGFLKDGVNYNFYDHPELQRAVKPSIVSTLRKQLAFGARRDAAIVLGTGKLLGFFQEINVEYGFFKRLIALEHPRFIMQYRRKRMAEYLRKYERAFAEALGR